MTTKQADDHKQQQQKDFLNIFRKSLNKTKTTIIINSNNSKSRARGESEFQS